MRTDGTVRHVGGWPSEGDDLPVVPGPVRRALSLVAGRASDSMSLAVGATLGPSAYWYLARGTGAVALVLLTASVVIGILGSVRFAAARWPRFAIDALHRDVSLLVLVVLVIHIVTSVLDGFAPITLLDGVIPFNSPYRPLWLGLGTLSFDLLVAIAVTSLVRRRIGYRAWRAIHWLAYASWPVAVLHGLGTGSDVKQWWMLALTVVCIVAVLVAVWTRIAHVASAHAGLRAPATALAVITPIGLMIFTVAGPLQTRVGETRRDAGVAARRPTPRRAPSCVRVAGGCGWAERLAEPARVRSAVRSRRASPAAFARARLRAVRWSTSRRT